MKKIFFAALLAASPLVQAQEQWTYSLTPYVWLPSINGKLKYEIPPGAGGAPEVDTGPNNYLEHLSMVLMLAGEARKGDWAIFTDFILSPTRILSTTSIPEVTRPNTVY